MTLGTPAIKIPEQLYSLAYPRIAGGPPVLYNGIEFRRTPAGSVVNGSIDLTSTAGIKKSQPAASAATRPNGNANPAVGFNEVVNLTVDITS